MSKLSNLTAPLGTVKKLKKKFPYTVGKRKDLEPKTYLITIEGNTWRKEKVTQEPDDNCIIVEGDKECAKTSEPVIDQNGDHYYFTRDGFKGTMALNEDTLLAGDQYKPSKGNTEEDDGYKGEIESLIGSKKTLKTMNESKRARKLLQPQSVDRTEMLTYIGLGVGAGFMIAQYMIQSGAIG